MIRRSLFALALALALVPSAPAQSAEEVLRETLSRYEAEMAGVDDYTLTQEVMGTEVTTYAERAGGEPLAYDYYLVTPGGLQGMGDDRAATSNPFLLLDRIADEAEYAGTEDVQGVRAHVVTVDDFGDIARGLGAVPEQAEGEFDIDRATFYLGTDDYRLHKMTMEGTMTSGGRTSPVRFETLLSDYRTTEGFTTSYRMAMTMRGAEGQVSDAEREDARRQLEQARAQMEEMPAAQREMMERMMGDRLEQLEQMLGGGGFSMEMIVTDVKVNTGRPVEGG
jgi:hypothetical protein